MPTQPGAQADWLLPQILMHSNLQFRVGPRRRRALACWGPAPLFPARESRQRSAQKAAGKLRVGTLPTFRAPTATPPLQLLSFGCCAMGNICGMPTEGELLADKAKNSGADADVDPKEMIRVFEKQDELYLKQAKKNCVQDCFLCEAESEFKVSMEVADSGNFLHVQEDSNCIARLYALARARCSTCTPCARARQKTSTMLGEHNCRLRTRARLVGQSAARAYGWRAARGISHTPPLCARRLIARAVRLPLPASRPAAAPPQALLRLAAVEHDLLLGRGARGRGDHERAPPVPHAGRLLQVLLPAGGDRRGRAERGEARQREGVLLLPRAQLQPVQRGGQGGIRDLDGARHARARRGANAREREGGRHARDPTSAPLTPPPLPPPASARRGALQPTCCCGTVPNCCSGSLKCCPCACTATQCCIIGCEVPFNIYKDGKDDKLGSIERFFPDPGMDAMTDAETFKLLMPTKVSHEMTAVFLATAVLINQLYFE